MCHFTMVKLQRLGPIINPCLPCCCIEGVLMLSKQEHSSNVMGRSVMAWKNITYGDIRKIFCCSSISNLKGKVLVLQLDVTQQIHAPFSKCFNLSKVGLLCFSTSFNFHSWQMQRKPTYFLQGN